MIFNPLSCFKKPNKYIYKEKFTRWLGTVFESLVGDFGAFGFLDYVFILPGLVKLACNPVDDSISQDFLCRFSNFLSFFKYLTAAILVIVSVPLTFILHKYICYKGSQLKNIILEIEALPIDQERSKNLGYRYDNLVDDRRCINKEKLAGMFYGDNSKNRIKFKNHPSLALFLKRNMGNYRIAPIQLEDNEGAISKEIIFGLFPAQFMAPDLFHGLDLDNLCGSSGYNPRIERGAFPALLIIPSKENREEIIAMEKFDAFYFSEARIEGLFFKDRVAQYSQQEDYFKKPQRQRCNIQFSLEQALRAAVNNTALAELQTSIDPLMPSIIQFAEVGVLTNADVNFAKEFRKNSTLYAPRVPYITPRPSEVKEAANPFARLDLAPKS